MTLRVPFVAIVFALLCPLSNEAYGHSFSVKDDIAMVRFSDPSFDPAIVGSEIARPSPHGDYVAIVTTKGLLATDEVESDLTVFRMKELSAFLDGEGTRPQPRIVASIVSYPHREQTISYAPVIKDLRWSPDGKGIYFRGENGSGAYQLYLARADGSGSHALTPADQSVDRFDVVADTVVYKVSMLVDKHRSEIAKINSDAFAATGARIQDVVFPSQLGTLEPEVFAISVLQHTNGRWFARRVPGDPSTEMTYLSALFPFVLSPKGHQLVAPMPVSTIPDTWQRFEPVTGSEYLRLLPGKDAQITNAGETLRPLQYMLIDLDTGKRTPLTDAPNARSLGYPFDNSRVAWTTDEKRVLATNTFLGTHDDNPLERNRPCGVASFDLPSFEPRCLFFEGKDLDRTAFHIEEVSFGSSDDEAIVTLTQRPNRRVTRRYRFFQDSWHLAGEDSAADIGTGSAGLVSPDISDVQISVRQSLNEPPKLWVSSRRTGKAREAWDPNPQLADMSFGEASHYEWEDKSGHHWSGLLVKPVGYQSGQRYPLVVQMYNYVDGEFTTDGLHPTAFAARHLASVGFVVLQVRRQVDTLSEADPEVHLEGYRSAIDSLAAAGMVDRNRVGVVGFSWTCWYAVNAIIKDPQLFKAATIADGLDNSYMQYLMFGAGSESLERQMEQIRQTAPFGHGLKKWVDEAPGFHLDQVQAPVRIEAINPLSVLQEWELYASLRLQNKPVDLIYFPHGTHIHQKPLERLESQQGSVDWFRFWLQGYEDPDPAKAAQYERWRGFAKLRAAAAQSYASPTGTTPAPSLP
ncbi:putative acylaminoacyl-peptidase [Granulicella sibirica]|uniref:Putative acylaminoacyl-peptidase n=1 Tax=Granulicella sibirica TaxID=2479048 RepID=A0A4Q0T3C6_9BACT|nr:putative acylaminoacyl-peptidase [Granulicella sibirica]